MERNFITRVNARAKEILFIKQHIHGYSVNKMSLKAFFPPRHLTLCSLLSSLHLHASELSEKKTEREKERENKKH
jgi:hypothetical protein